MSDWEDYVFGFFVAVVAVLVLSLFGFAVYHERNNPTLYTVKHGESIHYGSRIWVGSDNGVVKGTDANGREFIYRDGWEAIQEPTK